MINLVLGEKKEKCGHETEQTATAKDDLIKNLMEQSSDGVRMCMIFQNTLDNFTLFFRARVLRCLRKSKKNWRAAKREK